MNHDILGAPSFIARLVFVPVLMCGAHIAAQCAPHWPQGDGTRGTNGVVGATTMWDPDGAGPATPLLVVGGSFSIAGNVAANNIATYDPQTGAWSALGNGTDGSVSALVAHPNGTLVVGGSFAWAGGQRQRLDSQRRRRQLPGGPGLGAA